MTAPETVVRYYNFDIVFAEIPGETTLAINIANCPNRCPGCHSPHLQADAGHVLDAPELRALLERYGRSVTCVALWAGMPRRTGSPGWRRSCGRSCRSCIVGWYSGRQELPEGFAPQVFDYIKLGGWVESLGPLTSPTTNQRLYRIGPAGAMEDITEQFRHKP